jgi:uncharacterized protein
MTSSPSCLKQVAGTVFGFLFLLTPAHAASFDCGKAASEVEKLICGNEELSRLDESLNKAYLRVLERTNTKDQIMEKQRLWLKNVRNKCKNAECIRAAYENRIETISGGADEYVLVMSKDDCVCRHMLKIYNEDLKEHGEIKYDQHEEFKAIKWEKQKAYFEPGESLLKEVDILISKFDINNDGSPEIIIKDEHRTLNLVDSDALYVFREKDFTDFKDKIVINEDFAKKTIGAWGWGALGDETRFKGNVYRLHALPAFYALGGWFYFYPFVYQGKYFTSMHDWLPDAGKWWDTEYEKYVKKKWEVILLFTPENQLKDLCYLLKIPHCKNKNRNGG